MERISSVVKVYKSHKVIGILFLGFASGLPFLLTLGTLQAWLAGVGISKTTIGLFALATCPYSLKFLIAPAVDHIKIPFMTQRFGKRRAWILLSQVFLLISLIALGMSNPGENIIYTFLMTSLVTFFAANQDNAIEAYRIETLTEQQIGPGASASVIGFRIGMWVSGGGALYLAAYYSWFLVYFIMSLFVIVGIIATLMLSEPESQEESVKLRQMGFVEYIKNHYKPAVQNLLKHNDWKLIFIFIILFKVADAALNTMSIPFLLETGFSMVEIANIAKSFGIVAMITGGFIGGILLYHYSIINNLILSTVLLMVSSLMFMAQAYVGYDKSLLVATMGIENLACGLSATALIAYISQICPRKNLATNFAIYSSYVSLARIGISSVAGWMADSMSWISFYMLIGLLCIPCLLFLSFFSDRLIKKQSRVAV